MQVISPPKMTAFESGNGANNSVYSEHFESTKSPILTNPKSSSRSSLRRHQVNERDSSSMAEIETL